MVDIDLARTAFSFDTAVSTRRSHNGRQERIIGCPSGPQSVDMRIMRYMAAKLGRRSCVYFVSFNKWVKIGFSSDIWTRVEKLDCLPEPVVLLALVPGTRQLEWELHDRFSKYHSYAEWFSHEGKLAAHIQKLRDRALAGLR
jgi:hypothetical protein